MVKYDRDEYEIVSSKVLETKHVDDKEDEKQIPEWWHVYPPIKSFDSVHGFRASMADEDIDIIEIKFVSDTEGSKSGTFTMTYHTRKLIEKKKKKNKTVSVKKPQRHINKSGPVTLKSFM